MRTGGGYTYFKRDRPVEPHPGKHPLNWRHDDIDTNAYVYYDGACACYVCYGSVCAYYVCYASVCACYTYQSQSCTFYVHLMSLHCDVRSNQL